MLEAKKLQKLLLLNSSHNNKPKGEEKIQTEKGSNLETKNRRTSESFYSIK